MQMNCRNCGFTVAVGSTRSAAAEVCPLCLARSAGALSVRLDPRRVPKPVGPEGRVRELLRRLGPPRTAA